VAVPRLDEDEVSKVYLTDSLGRNQQITIVNEAGLYSLGIKMINLHIFEIEVHFLI
jgi:prophage antirepressor-like protein